MKGKIYFARGMSRVLLAVLYVLDIAGIYYITGDILYTVAGAAAILCILAIQMGVCLLTFRVHSIKNSPRGDANYLQSCMDEVMRRSAQLDADVKKSIYGSQTMKHCGVIQLAITS